MQTAAAPQPRFSLADWSSACITPQTANLLLARRTFVLHFYSLFLTKNWTKACLHQKHDVELCRCRGTSSMSSSICLCYHGGVQEDVEGGGRIDETDQWNRSDNECLTNSGSGFKATFSDWNLCWRWCLPLLLLQVAVRCWSALCPPVCLRLSSGRRLKASCLCS